MHEREAVGMCIHHGHCYWYSHMHHEERLCVCVSSLSLHSLLSLPHPLFHHLLLTNDPSLPSQLDIERQGIRFELEDLQNGPMVEPLLIEMIHMVSHMH